MLIVLAGAPAVVDPIYRDVITSGSVIVVALIGLVGTLAGLGYVKTGRKLDLTIAQTEPTSNGFTKEVREQFKLLEELLINIDTRVTRIEDKT